MDDWTWCADDFLYSKYVSFVIRGRWRVRRNNLSQARALHPQLDFPTCLSFALLENMLHCLFAKFCLDSIHYRLQRGYLGSSLQKSMSQVCTHHVSNTAHQVTTLPKVSHTGELTSSNCTFSLSTTTSQPSTSCFAVSRASCFRFLWTWAESLLRRRRRCVASAGNATPWYFATSGFLCDLPFAAGFIFLLSTAGFILIVRWRFNTSITMECQTFRGGLLKTETVVDLALQINTDNRIKNEARNFEQNWIKNTTSRSDGPLYFGDLIATSGGDGWARRSIVTGSMGAQARSKHEVKKPDHDHDNTTTIMDHMVDHGRVAWRVALRK